MWRLYCNRSRALLPNDHVVAYTGNRACASLGMPAQRHVIRVPASS